MASRVTDNTVALEAAQSEGSNIRELYRGFGSTRRRVTNGWIGRRRAGPTIEVAPAHHSPRRTPAEVAQAEIEIRRSHPSWAGRKIHHVLRRPGVSPLPHPHTITGILHRHGLIAAEDSAKHRPFQRFERAQPNDLWQMDFKGHFSVAGRYHPLTWSLYLSTMPCARPPCEGDGCAAFARASARA